MAKRVPVALHSELSEYASLVRSLRTNSVLDLSTQASQFGASSSRSSQFEDEDEEEVDQLDPTDTEAEAEDPELDTCKGVKPQKTSTLTAEQKELQSAHRKTRWPLRLQKAPQPEFELAEEVQALICHYRRRKYALNEEYHVQTSGKTGRDVSASGVETCEADNECHTEHDFEEDSGSEDEDVALPVLASLTAAHLRSILDICAAHVPKVSAGMHNRLRPIDWKGVLLAASSSGTVPSEVIDRVESRLRTMYSSGKESSETGEVVPNSAAALRRNILRTSQVRLGTLLAATIEAGDGDLLRIVGPPAKLPRKQRKL